MLALITHLLFADNCYLFFRARETKACTLKRILHRYEVLSAQASNYNKLSITFSPNTSVVDRVKINVALEVQEISVLSKYLGLPMYVGRNKCGVFGFLVDIVGQKLQG